MASSQIVYWRGSGEVRADVMNALRSVGYTLKVVYTYEELHNICQIQKPDLLVVDASSGENEASTRVVELTGAQIIHSVPVIYIAAQAAKRGAALKREYETFLPIDLPFNLPGFVEQLCQLCPPTKIDSTDGAANQDTKPNPIEAKTSRLILRSKLAVARNPAKIKSGIGGDVFAAAQTPGSFDDSELVPQHPRREAMIKALQDISISSQWLGLHARRVAYVSSAFTNNLGLDEARDNRVRTAALLLNWGLKDLGTVVQSSDLFFENSKGTSHRIALAVKNSGDFVKQEMQDEVAAQMIYAIGEKLQGNSPLEDDEILFDSDTVLATELTDRACWGTGKWDPFGAHRAIRGIAAGVPVKLPKNIADCVGRVLTEAADTRQTIGRVAEIDDATRELYGKAVREATAEAESVFGKSEQRKVQITELKPGMLLARPIVSWDGRLVLPANIRLSEEMIKRLWQLSTIRPFRLPLQVQG